MKVEVIKCNNCAEIVNDHYDEIGWITIKGANKISISGGRREDRCADTFRFISSPGRLDFCSLSCMIEYLYFKEGYFNNSNLKTLDQKIESIEHTSRKNQIESLVNYVTKILKL